MKNLIYKDNKILKSYQGTDADDHHLINDWFNLYSKYAELEPRAVKVLSIDKKRQTFEMEKINGFSLDDHKKLAALSLEEHKLIIKELTSIVSNFFNFKHELVPNDSMFLHMDIHVGNLMLTDSKELKLIDPDSCFISVMNEPRNITFYGKYVDTLLYLREFLRK